MAKRKSNRRAESLSDFAGPDHDKEQIEKLAKAAADANGKAGHNSGEPPDEVVQRNAVAIEVALSEVDAALRIVQAARANLGVARKTAKTDLGSKAWVDSVVAAVKLKRQSEKGGTGEIVTEHRQMGRVLRLMNCPLGTQFNLFGVAAETEIPESLGGKNGMDAELQGQHAWRNSEPESNNPFQAGSENHVMWQQGFRNAMAAHAGTMGDGAAAH